MVVLVVHLCCHRNIYFLERKPHQSQRGWRRRATFATPTCGHKREHLPGTWRPRVCCIQAILQSASRRLRVTAEVFLDTFFTSAAKYNLPLLLCPAVHLVWMFYFVFIIP